MWLFLWDSEPSKIFVGDTPISKVFLWDTQIRPTWPDKDYLCFTAEQSSSTVKLTKTWSPTAVTLETSTDWITWATYTIWDTITLANVWDKVYWRNTSDTVTNFSTSSASSYYQFVMSWQISASWDCNFLLCKNSTDTLPNSYCFVKLFNGCSVLVSAPSLLATTIKEYCYYYMFSGCSSLATIPSLPAITLKTTCYNRMFDNCSLIKLSTTQTWEYQTAYRIPTTWTWTTASNALSNMFNRTWWTFTWSPTINTTYYTSNTVV